MLVTLAFEDSGPELQRAKRLIDNMAVNWAVDQTGAVAPDELAGVWWSKLQQRLGPQMRAMAEAAARLHQFSAWQVLADAMGHDVKVATVQSWHRNAGRSIKRVNAELGVELTLFAWDVKHNAFTMNEPVRRAILGKLTT